MNGIAAMTSLPTSKTWLYMASDAKVAVVLFRKTHRVSHILKLDYSRPTNPVLLVGSKFNGVIYANRCDISPDGGKFVYFAMTGQKTTGPETWTGVCTPPYLKADIFLPENGTWEGGGQYLADGRLLIFGGDKFEGDLAKTAESSIVRYRDWEGRNDKLVWQFRAEHEAIVSLVPCPKHHVSKTLPLLRRSPKPRNSNKLSLSYDIYSYELVTPELEQLAESEILKTASWAGWGNDGRLFVAKGNILRIYEIEDCQKLGEPVIALDLMETVTNHEKHNKP